MNILPHKKTWLQILFWCGFWALIPLILSGGLNNPDIYLKRTIVVMVAVAVVVWINMEILLPRLYFGRFHPVVYIIAGLVLVAMLTMLLEWDGAPWEEFFRRNSEQQGPPKPGNTFSGGRKGMRYLGMGMPVFTSIIGSALFEIAAFASKKEQEAAVYKSEKLEAEIKFLKSQINPHFLFNALNNIYTLTLLKSDNAPDHLLKLSGMLRYMLYDCKAETVPLHKEIAYLQHFIDLQMLKDSCGLNVKVHFDESRPNLNIAPMLLIPFVENAFKHSKIEDLDKGWIKIDLRTGDGTIEFVVENSLPGHNVSKDKVGGIGLKNVRRQLELLYPERHALEISEKDGVFRVGLRVEI
ncbi:MAG: histidine kinase [Saprospiraceae bacterium]|nr:histidine kinase [Saprospiraceae bacterium]